MFTDQLTRAIAAARTPQLDQRSTPDIRAARSRTRRRLHEPRPTATPEINARIGQWKNNIKAACLAGYIGQSYDKYLHELLTISSVARGDYCLYSDKEMAQRLNLRGDGSRTVRRHRAAATKQGLLEVLGHGKDRKPCMVRPVLRDGSPVFLSRPELAGRSDTFVRLTRTTLAADLLLTDTLKTEDYPPLPPAVPDGPEEGERVFDRVEDEEPAKSAESARPAGTAQTAPAEPPAGPDAIKPAKPVMSFSEFWLAMGRTGNEGYARAKWGKLSATDKAAIQDRLGRPHSWAADMWAGKWLECRVWEETPPVAGSANRPEQVYIREGTPEWRCWQRYLAATKGKGTPVDNRGGWWFPSRLPPLTDAEVPSKGQAHSSHEAPLDAESCPQHFTRRWPAPALCGRDDAGNRRAHPEKTKEVCE